MLPHANSMQCEVKSRLPLKFDLVLRSTFSGFARFQEMKGEVTDISAEYYNFHRVFVLCTFSFTCLFVFHPLNAPFN